MAEGEESRRRGLGRGLSSLLGEERPDLDSGAARTMPVERLYPGRYQPRQRFNTESLSALADSIREKGIVEPIVVRSHPDRPGDYEIVAGERRWRAAQEAKLHEVPVVLRELGDRDALEIALVENIHRDDLSPLEEAEAYRRLMEEFSHTQEALARAVGKSRSHVANALRLLGLPDSIKENILDGQLSAGHARALVTTNDPEALAEIIIAKGLNVRQAEQLARRGKQKSDGARPRGRPPKQAKDPNTAALERDLGAMLGLRVGVEERGAGGVLAIHYETLEQLDDLLQRLSGGANP